MPGQRTLCRGKRGISMAVTVAGSAPAGSSVASAADTQKPPVARRLRSDVGGGQCAQERALPASSAVRKLEPQPQPETAFGLLTVKPAPIRVST